MSSEEAEPRRADHEKHWQIARLATQLVAEGLSRKFPLAMNFTNDDEPLLNEIESAISRAKLILELVENPRKQSISLYQLFEEGLQFTETQLTETIARSGWTGRKDETIRKELLGPLRDSWRDRLDRRKQLVDSGALLVEEVLSRIKETLGRIERDFDVTQIFPEFPSWSESLSNSLITQWPLPATDQESQQISWEKEECLFHWCIQEKSSSGRKVSKREYRPHELFRFTEQFSWFPDAFKRRSLDELTDELKIGPKRTSHWSQFKRFQNDFWSTPSAQEYLATLPSKRESEE